MKKNNKAISLVEMMICSVIIVIILGAVMNVVNAGRTSFYTNSIKLELFEKARLVLNSIKGEVLQSRVSLLSIPADGNYYNVLSFKIPQSIDENGNITWSQDITYAMNNNELTKTQNGQTEVITPNITNLRFRIDGNLPRVLEIYVTTSKNNHFGENMSINIDTFLRLRN